MRLGRHVGLVRYSIFAANEMMLTLLFLLVLGLLQL